MQTWGRTVRDMVNTGTELANISPSIVVQSIPASVKLEVSALQLVTAMHDEGDGAKLVSGSQIDVALCIHLFPVLFLMLIPGEDPDHKARTGGCDEAHQQRCSGDNDGGVLNPPGKIVSYALSVLSHNVHSRVRAACALTGQSRYTMEELD